MAKVQSYGSARTYPAEYLPTESTSLNIGDLCVLSNGNIVAAGENEPTYLVIGKTVSGIVPVCAILDDMVLESSSAITGFDALGNGLYRK